MERDCHVCGSTTTRTLYHPSASPGPVVQCENCGFVYVNPIENGESLIQDGSVLGDRPASLLTASDLSLIQGSWEEPIIQGYMEEQTAKRANAREALSHLYKIRPAHGKILDYGCFCGLFLDVAQQDGWQAFGLEPLVMPGIYARGSFGINVTTDTLRHNTFAPDFFDVITAFQVFEHIVEPEPEAEKLKRFLKPGGLLMIEVPNIETLGVRLLGRRHRHFVADHVSFFSAETLSRFLSNLGFEVYEVYYPSRVLSLDHMAWWLGKVTTSSVGDALVGSVKRFKLDSRTIQLNLGDIVSVIARKA